MKKTELIRVNTEFANEARRLAKDLEIPITLATRKIIREWKLIKPKSFKDLGGIKF